MTRFVKSQSIEKQARATNSVVQVRSHNFYKNIRRGRKAKGKRSESEILSLSIKFPGQCKIQYNTTLLGVLYKDLPPNLQN